jgi:hypothetical protein
VLSIFLGYALWGVVWGLPITLLLRVAFGKLFGPKRLAPLMVAHAVAFCALCYVLLFGFTTSHFDDFRSAFLTAAKFLWSVQAVFLACDLMGFWLLRHGTAEDEKP